MPFAHTQRRPGRNLPLFSLAGRVRVAAAVPATLHLRASLGRRLLAREYALRRDALPCLPHAAAPRTRGASSDASRRSVTPPLRLYVQSRKGTRVVRLLHCPLAVRCIAANQRKAYSCIVYLYVVKRKGA